MKKSNFALRLQPSLMGEAKKVAKAEGVAVNQFMISAKNVRISTPELGSTIPVCLLKSFSAPI